MKLLILITLFSSISFAITCKVNVKDTKADKTTEYLFAKSDGFDKATTRKDLAPYSCGVNILPPTKLKNGKDFTIVSVYCNLNNKEDDEMLASGSIHEDEENSPITLLVKTNKRLFEIEAICK